MMIKVMDQSTATWDEIFDDPKVVDTTVTKNTSGNTLRCDGLNVPLRKKASLQ